MKRKIAVVTGSRAEYGYLRPLMKKIKDDEELEFILYITGMHLVKEYGNTLEEIKRDGFEITGTVNMEIKVDNSPYDFAASIGKGIIGFAEILKKNTLDIIIVFGDRTEPFAAAVAASTMNIPVVHINGGDIGLGDIDNNIRHAITKFSHLHFTASKKSMERILKLGEEEWRVYHVGALSLDTILNEKLLSKDDLCKKYNIFNIPYILLSYHPISSEWEEAESQIRLVMEAVNAIAKQENLGIIITYPSAYPGGYQIIQVIKEYSNKNQNILLFENFPHIHYVSLMKNSALFVGNSSSGIIEAPSLGIPYVCVGERQYGRERAKNVIDVSYKKEEIINSIKKALFDQEFLNEVKKCESPYGDGTASQKIVNLLRKIKIDNKLIKKKMTY